MLEGEPMNPAGPALPASTETQAPEGFYQHYPLLPFAVLVDFMDEVRRCRTMADVNVAAGACLHDLLVVAGCLEELLAGEGTDELGELIHLPLEPS
jgi:hypothetical protein